MAADGRVVLIVFAYALVTCKSMFLQTGGDAP